MSLRTMTRRARRGVVLVVVVAAAVVAGCTGERPRLGDVEETTTTAPGATTTTEPAPATDVAQASGTAIDVYPDATAEAPVQQIVQEEATSSPGIPMVFLVIGRSDDRLQVRLPTPPGGGTGWIRRQDVAVSTVTLRIEVALGEHRLRVLDRDRVVMDEPIAVGTTDRPAPGPTFLKELLQPPDPSGAYGTYVYGLAGFTTDLDGFNTGAGIVGLHATDDPATLGQDVASGSIQVHGDVLTRLVAEVGLPLGTPVEVIA